RNQQRHEENMRRSPELRNKPGTLELSKPPDVAAAEVLHKV
ncbi:hypothetical protein QTP70_030830, partial [Hemibagrus guttatus]